MEPKEKPEGWVSAQDLTEIWPLMEQVANATRARHVSLEDFLRLFNPDLHGKIRGAALAPGITHVVCLENLDMWSSRCGHRMALTVGVKPDGAETPTWTIEQVLKTPYFRMGDTPSRFAYPVAYAAVETLREHLPAQEREPDLDVKKYGG